MSLALCMHANNSWAVGSCYQTVPASANRSRHFDRLDIVGWYKSAERFWDRPCQTRQGPA
eukprot:CAMPEP_0181464622 /NCGR_PEP_ID=MMETSP1110-20121109/35528_1 /TAXON_ID=174948 /ORGANISM="Symbiodinium sp., Strain CCMP421" /LENGTH=59 /DNA_ID=CAMNT_0023589363 /DNA_START=110 /DNA_END=286 /DNA_ORIENTATION=-